MGGGGGVAPPPLPLSYSISQLIPAIIQLWRLCIVVSYFFHWYRGWGEKVLTIAAESILLSDADKCCGWTHCKIGSLLLCLGALVGEGGGEVAGHHLVSHKHHVQFLNRNFQLKFIVFSTKCMKNSNFVENSIVKSYLSFSTTKPKTITPIFAFFSTKLLPILDEFHEWKLQYVNFFKIVSSLWHFFKWKSLLLLYFRYCIVLLRDSAINIIIIIGVLRSKVDIAPASPEVLGSILGWESWKTIRCTALRRSSYSHLCTSSEKRHQYKVLKKLKIKINLVYLKLR